MPLDLLTSAKAADLFNGQPLQMDADPFMSNAANHSSRQVQTAFREIIRQILQQTPVVLVTGPASAGKTLLVDMTARLCNDTGLSVRRVDRGDLLHIALGQHSDVLLVDEANSVADASLEAFSPERRSSTATTTIFLGLPSCVPRFSPTIDPVLIQFDLLSRSDAEHYLRERAAAAGFTDLFSDEALEQIVDASNGSPRLLRRIASMAFLNAAADCAAQIQHKHAASTFAMQLPPNATAHQPKQSVAAEDPPIPRVKGDEGLILPEKALSQAEGTLPRIGATANESRPDAKRAMNLDGLGNDIWSDKINELSEAPFETFDRHSEARTLLRRGLLAACVAIVVGACAIAVVRPWNWIQPVASNSAASPQSLPVAVGNPGAAEAAAPPVIPAEAADNAKTEPVPSAPENSRQVQKKPESAEAVNSPEPAEPKAAVPRPLSGEEKAAVAKGIQELERAQTQAFQRSRR
jgi:hypothetical protein